MHFAFLLPVLLSVGLVSAKSVRHNPTAKRATSSKYVTTVGDQFHLNGSAYKFVGTNAYWLHALNSDEDISNTFANMTAAGIRVVRTWGFNDVHVVPVNGTWFQLIANGTLTINNGTNGLQRLDRVVQLAEQHGIYLMVSLTNNWNPLPGIDDIDNSNSTSLRRRDVTPGTDNDLPRNYLSNDYGGMDAYVRQFGVVQKHDEFYTNETIINLFKNYTSNIVSRYKDSPAIFGWELANDPRCNSTLPSTSTCTTQTVTKWHATLAKHVRSVDPNHLVSSGNHGFFCTDCKKIYPVPKPAPTPQTSATAGRRKRASLLSKKNLLKERAETRKLTREQKKREGGLVQSGIKIRGRWAATPTRRQDTGLGPGFDGSQGVDSEDILGIPEIGFASFQLFPDQNNYEPDDPNLDAYNNTVQEGISWIQKQAQAGATYGKPVALTGFGLVTQDNGPFFILFNSTTPFNSTNSTSSTNGTSTPPVNSTTSTIVSISLATTSTAISTSALASATNGTVTTTSSVALPTNATVTSTSSVSLITPTNATTTATSIGPLPTTGSTNGTMPANSTTSVPGLTDGQRDAAYQQWLQSGIAAGINGMLQYQWGQGNLSTSAGTTISPNTTGTSPNPPSTGGTSSNPNTTVGVSPNDGYSISGVGQDGAQGVITTASQQIGTDSSST